MDASGSWETWVFLGIVAALTAGVLTLWSVQMRRWRRLLPERNPPGWTPSHRDAAAAGTAGRQYGSRFESDTDPRALWRLFHQLPDQLVAVRRPKYPRPTGVLPGSMALTAGADAEVDDTRVLLTGLTARSLRVASAIAEELQGQPGGADRFVDALVEAGAIRVPAGEIWADPVADQTPR